ncbi:RluA family pseudouridine synthase [bacterium]|nr:RluA family pseudouridine synthase [bacterium]
MHPCSPPPSATPLPLLSHPSHVPALDRTRVEHSLYSKRHHFRYDLDPADNEKTLFEYLSEKLPHISKESWEERADFGGLYLNGIRVSSDRRLPSRGKIEYYEPKYDYQNPEEVYAPFHSDFILWEDSHLAFVYKPPQLPTQPNREQRRFSLRTALEQHYGRAVHIPSRLDTATAGIVPVSIHREMNEPLQRLFERRLVSKRYLCAVANSDSLTAAFSSSSSVQVAAPIGQSPCHPVLREVSPEDGVEALTEFTLLPSPPPSAPSRLLLAKPITGRTHQIRVHCAAFFGPIIGDSFYGGRAHPSLHLACVQLSLFHPISPGKLTVSLPEHLTPPWART